MRFLPRPSKIFVFDTLAHELSKYHGEVGLDAGSARFKNRPLFHTKTYYGLDYDLPALQRGIREYGEHTWGIFADLCHVESLPSNSVDVVVSTNTLYHLPKEHISTTITELSRVTRPRGVFILELPIDAEFDSRLALLNPLFAKIRVIYYRNVVSRAYEALFEDKKNGFLGSHPVAGSKPFLVLSWLLSRVEYLTCGIRKLNRHALIIADEKHSNIDPELFDLRKFSLVGEKIYDLSVIKTSVHTTFSGG